jgi:hypothetical protein
MYPLGYGQCSRGTVFPEKTCIDTDAGMQKRSVPLPVSANNQLHFSETKS